MIPLLTLSLAQAELLIQTNLEGPYIEGQEIHINIRIQNIGESMETLPNLEVQTSRIEWTIVNTKGTHKIRSASGGDQENWTLKPRQMKEIRYQIPNSAAFPLGTQKIQLLIDLPEVYTENVDLTILKRTPLWTDNDILQEQSYFPQNHYLWGQTTSKDKQSVFLESTRSIPLFIANKDERFQQSISHRDKHIYGIQNAELTLLSQGREEIQKRQHIPLAWKQATSLARAITDPEQRFHLPLWIPDPNKESGMIRSVTISNKGDISYRKIIHLDEKPVSVDSAITSTGIPLYLIQTKTKTYLFLLSQTGDTKIDLLPPQSVSFETLNSTETQLQSQFGIDLESGLIVHVLRRQEENLLSVVYSLQGQELKRSNLKAPELTVESAIYHQSQLYLLATNQQSWMYHSGNNWQDLDLSKYPLEAQIKIVPQNIDAPEFYISSK